MTNFFGSKTNTPNAQRALSRLMMTSALVAAGTLVLSTSAIAGPWDDVSGVGFTNTPGGADATNITVTTANGKASGTGNLDILAGQTVYVDAKLFVARDNRDKVQTSILGNLNSNGTVVLVDRNGVVFGKDSVVNVGSIIATTGDLSDAQVLGNADTPLQFSNFGAGEIVNGGSIEAAGLVAFVAPTVRNNGIINANLGRVSLAAGKSTATVDLYGDGLVEFAASPIVAADSEYLSENNGSITGKKIQMTAAAAKSVADSVVNMQGILTANGAAVNSKGQIVLSAGTVKLGSASKKSPSIKGNVNVKATQVDLGLTIDGAVTGSAKLVNVLSVKAKIAQGLDIISTGGTVNVASGTYDEHLIINKAGVTLNGANAGIAGDGVRGAETIIIPNSPGVTITADNVTIDGLTFTGATGTNGYGIYVNAADNVTLKNNIISDTSRNGIFVNNSNISTILNNKIDQTNSHGIYIYGGNGVEISANHIGMSGTDGNIKGDGIRVVSSENISITDNHIKNTDNVTGNLGSGIYIGKSINSDIAGNTISKAGWDGIKIEQSSSNQVTDNLISEITRTGITFNSSSDSLATGNKILGVGHRGFWIVGNNNLNIANNQVSSAGLEGIISDINFDLTIQDNILISTGLDGVRISNNTGILDVSGNEVSDLGLNGLYIYNSVDANVTNNKIDTAKEHGIYVDSSNDANISENQIGLLGGASNIKGDGIRGILSNNLLIVGNIIKDISSTAANVGSGIYLGNSSDSQIANNNISFTSWDGIKVEEGRNNIIKDNSISDVNRTGIALSYTSNVAATGNTISNSGRRGFWSLDNESLTISSNFISNSGLEGIISDKDTSLTILDNTIIGSELNGIYAKNTLSSLIISGNEIASSSVNGVFVENATDYVEINDNNISVSGVNGILVKNYSPEMSDEQQTEFSALAEGDEALADQLIISGNDIDNSEQNGIELYQVGGLVTVSSNQITDSGYNGILAYNPSEPFYAEGEEDFFGKVLFGSTPIELHIVNNIVENVGFGGTGEGEGGEGDGPQLLKIGGSSSANYLPFGFAAVNIDVSGDGYAELSGNTLGNNFEYGVIAYSGTIDLTGATNTIQNTDIGLGFYPGSAPEGDDSEDYFDYLANRLNLVNDTIGTTAFIDQSELFIDLGYGAMFAPGTPTVLDGNNSTYTLGSVTIDPAANGGFVTADELNTLETYINHYNDEQDRGLFFFSVLPSFAQAIDQKDVLRELFVPFSAPNGGSLTITGLPSIGGSAGGVSPAPTGAFDPNAIEPAAGDEEGSPTGEVAAVEPAAGGDTGCWEDATTSLGQGTPVTFNFGAESSALLQDAASCGNGGQAL